MLLTPFHQVSDFSKTLTLEEKITIFFEQTYGWQLDIADQCINGTRGSDGALMNNGIPHAGYAVLHIVMSYFEMIAKYKGLETQHGWSKEFFEKGLHDVFPILTSYPSWVQHAAANMLYKGVRCGLYHAGVTEAEIILVGNSEDMNDPIVLEAPHPKFLKRMYINPYIFPSILKQHLEQYIHQLRDTTNTTLRERFEKRFTEVRNESWR